MKLVFSGLNAALASNLTIPRGLSKLHLGLFKASHLLSTAKSRNKIVVVLTDTNRPFSGLAVGRAVVSTRQDRQRGGRTSHYARGAGHRAHGRTQRPSRRLGTSWAAAAGVVCFGRPLAGRGGRLW